MLLVKTRLAPSPIHGIGLFADQDISRGELVQAFDPNIDGSISYYFLELLPEPVRKTIRKYGYRNYQGLYILCADDARFLNHSMKPNLVAGTGYETDVAARDIAAGEELTVNYYNFDFDASIKLAEVTEGID